ncbi:MAG: DUF1697 domain-containing protein [Dehalococcoidia bacterium]
MPRYVALLRGVNVGGKNRLPMSDLAALVTELGCSNVRTYIQSGNVLFEAPAATARGLPGALSAALEERMRLRVPVVMRSASELASAIDANPFLARGVPSEALHVAFLAATPAATRGATLDASRSLEMSSPSWARILPLPAERHGAVELTSDYLDCTRGP